MQRAALGSWEERGIFFYPLGLGIVPGHVGSVSVLSQRASSLSLNLKALFLAVTGRVEGITAASVAVKWLTPACPVDPGPLSSDPS